MAALHEQAFISLIPRHSGTFPPELLELSKSLLAQSKNKASNLKAEEEIARVYACANLACERLKSALNLPPIEPRPPIPPRQYKKLYAYFDSALTISAPTPKRKSTTKTSSTNTPILRSRRKSSAAQASTPTAKALPQRSTPSKSHGLGPFRPNRTPKSGLKYNTSAENAARIPPWIAPTVRALCRAMESGRATGHVLAGVESVLCLPSPREISADGKEGCGNEAAGKKKQGKVPALVAAMWFFVARKLSGKEMTGKEYIKQRRKVVEVLNGVKGDEIVRGKVGDEEEGWREWEVVKEKDVNEWLTCVSEGGWLELEWLRDVQEGRGLSLDDDDDEEEEDEELEGIDEAGEKSGRQRATETTRGGLGTMRQDTYDYLSEARREEYEEWKADILARCDELEAEGELNDEMDTAEG